MKETEEVKLEEEEEEEECDVEKFKFNEESRRQQLSKQKKMVEQQNKEILVRCPTDMTRTQWRHNIIQ